MGAADVVLPGAPGAYALVIRLDRDFSGTVGALGEVVLAAGFYAYCGSANGPGGIAARVRRHLRTEKRLHWHIDYLCAAGKITDVALWPGGDECAFVGRLAGTRGAGVPVRGFGASDCARCDAHLLALAGDRNAVLRALRPLAGLRVYSAASLAESAATQPSIV
jgi:Uri superfamily endonuclease